MKLNHNNIITTNSNQLLLKCQPLVSKICLKRICRTIYGYGDRIIRNCSYSGGKYLITVIMYAFFFQWPIKLTLEFFRIDLFFEKPCDEPCLEAARRFLNIFPGDIPKPKDLVCRVGVFFLVKIYAFFGINIESIKLIHQILITPLNIKTSWLQQWNARVHF